MPLARTPMTPQGRETIRLKIKQLKSVERPRVLVELEAARAHGDLSENAEYHAAKEKLGHIDGQMKHFEHHLSKAEVIDPKKMRGQDKVMFGAHVTLLELESDEETTYQIVGDLESDISRGCISVSSPIARALIGKRKEDEVKVRTPKGVKEFEILEVEYK